MTTRALRLAAEPDANAIRSAMTWLRLGTATVSAAGLYLVLLYVAPSFSATVIATALVYGASELVNELSQSILLGEDRTRAAAVTLLVRRLIPLGVLSFVLLIAPDLALQAILASSVATTLITLVVQRSLRFKPAPIVPLIAGSRHYWTQALWSSLQQVDVLLVQVIMGSYAAGLYSAASRLLSPLALVTTSILGIFVPAMSRETNDAARWRIHRSSLRVVMYYSAGLVAASPLVALVGPIVLGPTFAASWVLFVAFTVGAAINAICQVQFGLLFSVGQARTASRASFLGTFLGLVALTLAASTQSLSWLGVFPIVTFGATLLAVAPALRRMKRDQDKSTDQ
ncbi:hypothetical protein BH10ACT5_BH10ACT5_08860 [soil metagenome]